MYTIEISGNDDYLYDFKSFVSEENRLDFYISKECFNFKYEIIYNHYFV